MVYPFAGPNGIQLAPYAGFYSDYYFNQDDATAIVAAGGVPLASTPLLQGWSARATAGVGAKFAGGAMVADGHPLFRRDEDQARRCGQRLEPLAAAQRIVDQHHRVRAAGEFGLREAGADEGLAAVGLHLRPGGARKDGVFGGDDNGLAGQRGD